MKQMHLKVLVVMLFLFCSKYEHAQTLPNFDLIKLGQARDYKAADPFALQTANYLLSTPFQKDNSDRMKSLQFIANWMNGTPDHSFILDRKAVGKLTNNNNDLLGLYMAAMVKYSLENKDSSKDPKLVKLNTLTMFLNYCENKENHISMPKELKKLSEARAKGQLEQYL